LTVPVRLTVFPRLECCVPDFTGKNAILARVLRETQAQLADRVRIEVVPAASRFDRLGYYLGMVDALAAAGYELPSARNGSEWAGLRRELDSIRAGVEPGPDAMARLRRASLSLFTIPPVIAVNGRAAFVSRVPSVEELGAAVLSALADQPHQSDHEEEAT